MILRDSGLDIKFCPGLVNFLKTYELNGDLTHYKLNKKVLWNKKSSMSSSETLTKNISTKKENKKKEVHDNIFILKSSKS